MRNRLTTRIAVIAAVAVLLITVFVILIATDWFFPDSGPTPTVEPSSLELQVHFIDVGQGDTILVDLGDTEVLIDGGDRSPGITEYLEDYVNGDLEVMVATHPHADHIGGLIEVLDDFDVEEIWLNGDTSTSKTYSDFMTRVNAEGAEVEEARIGETIEVGNLVTAVFRPYWFAPLMFSTSDVS